ncbi:MAG: hypothetical protein U0271_29630 [Polyangiaceae bacterium]
MRSLGFMSLASVLGLLGCQYVSGLNQLSAGGQGPHGGGGAGGATVGGAGGSGGAGGGTCSEVPESKCVDDKPGSCSGKCITNPDRCLIDCAMPNAMDEICTSPIVAGPDEDIPCFDVMDASLVMDCELHCGLYTMGAGGGGTGGAGGGGGSGSTGAGPCASRRIICPSNSRCDVYCDGEGACWDTTILCDSGPCNVHCSGNGCSATTRVTCGTNACSYTCVGSPPPNTEDLQTSEACEKSGCML